MKVNVDMLHWSITVLIKTSGSGIENENMSHQNQLSQNLKKGKYTQLL